MYINGAAEIYPKRVGSVGLSRHVVLLLLTAPEVIQNVAALDLAAGDAAGPSGGDGGGGRGGGGGDSVVFGYGDDKVNSNQALLSERPLMPPANDGWVYTA